MSIKRIIEFPNRPDLEALGVPLSDWNEGSSLIRLIEDGDNVSIRPEAVPVKTVGVFLYSCLALFAFGAALAHQVGWQPAAPAVWGMVIMAALIVVPLFVRLLFLTTRTQRGTGYLEFNKVTGVVRLPRLEREWPVGSIESVVFSVLSEKSNGMMYQVALLVRSEDATWSYVHVYSDAGDNHSGPGNETDRPTFGLSEHQKLAKALGVSWTYVRFRRDGTLAKAVTSRLD